MNPLDRINQVKTVLDGANLQLEILKTEVGSIPPPPPNALEISITSSPPDMASIVVGTRVTIVATVKNAVGTPTLHAFRNGVPMLDMTDTPPVGSAIYRVEVIDSDQRLAISNIITVNVSSIVVSPSTLVRGIRNVRSFSVPSIGGSNDRESFNYGGRALSLTQNGNLIVGGFEEGSRIGELTIPASGTATLVQFGDPLNGRLSSISQDSGKKIIGGTLDWKGKLVVAAYVFYDGNASQVLSHFIRPFKISDTAGLVGPLRAGSMGAGFYSGYMAHVPSDWQAKLGGPALTGNCCLDIISRTSFGPCVHSFDPDRIGSAKAMVYYDDAHHTLGDWYPPAKQYFGQSDRIGGVAIVNGSRTLLFAGRHGTTSCYGTGTSCNDPADNNQGTHGYPYEPSIWAYDLDECVKAINGTKRPWEVVPYARFVIPGVTGSSKNIIGGMAINHANNKIYVSHMYADSGARPKIYELEATF